MEPKIDLFNMNALIESLFDPDEEVDYEFIGELLVGFLDDVPTRLEALTLAINNENYEEIRIIGHTIKGASANLNSPLLTEFGSKIEIAGKKENLDESKCFSELFSTNFDLFEQKVTKYID